MKKLLVGLLAMMLAIPALATTYNVSRAKHATLVLLTVDTVNVSTYCNYITIYNGGGTDIYSRMDGSSPTAGGDDTTRIPANTWRVLATPDPANVQVKLLSSVAVSYSVEC